MANENKILVCLFTYNRPVLLKNALKSIDKLFPYGDRLLLDDGSTHNDVKDYLKELRSEGRWEIYVNAEREERMLGGLYTNQKHALTTALKRGYDYCFFIEDDAQFVWAKPDYMEYIDRVFANCVDALQICPWFFRRCIEYYVDLEGEKVSIEYEPAARAYRYFTGLTSTGIINLNVVRQHPDFDFIDHYGTSRAYNSGYWLDRGYHIFWQFEPTVAIVPWVNSLTTRPGRKNVAEGIDRGNSSSGYLLNPLSAKEIEFIKNRPVDQPIFQEYSNLCPSNVIRPIWHRKGEQMNQYYAMCRKVADVEDTLQVHPIPIPIRKTGRSSRVGKHPVHLQRYSRFQSEWTENDATDLIAGRNEHSEPAPPPALPSSRHLDRLRWIAPRFIKSAVRVVVNSYQEFLVWWAHRYGPSLFPLIRDYLGYHRLRRRLRKEQLALPYDLDFSHPRCLTKAISGGRN